MCAWVGVTRLSIAHHIAGSARFYLLNHITVNEFQRLILRARPRPDDPLFRGSDITPPWDPGVGFSSPESSTKGDRAGADLRPTPYPAKTEIATPRILPRRDRREVAAVFAGGALGTLLRAALSETFPHSPTRWPWPTLPGSHDEPAGVGRRHLIGGCGSVRFLVDGAVGARLGRDFPFGTLAVNVSGAMILGRIGRAGSSQVTKH